MLSQRRHVLVDGQQPEGPLTASNLKARGLVQVTCWGPNGARYQPVEGRERVREATLAGSGTKKAKFRECRRVGRRQGPKPPPTRRARVAAL